MRPEIRPGRVADLSAVQVDLLMVEEQAILIDLAEARGAELGAHLADFSRTLVLGDRPLAIFGIWGMWPRVAQAWTLISDEARKDYPKSLYKGVKIWLEVIIAREDLVRVQTTVRFGHPKGHAFIQHLGFRNPQLMRCYGIGGVGDYYLYERIQP